VRTPLQIAGALLCAMLWTGSVSAAGLQVSPVVIELSTAQKNAIISLRNDGATETRYQANVVTWSQDENGQMKFAPTRDLVLFPLLLGLKPPPTNSQPWKRPTASSSKSCLRPRGPVSVPRSRC
jgi:P pilus assembly chaperone PapD